MRTRHLSMWSVASILIIGGCGGSGAGGGVPDADASGGTTGSGGVTATGGTTDGSGGKGSGGIVGTGSGGATSGGSGGATSGGSGGAMSAGSGGSTSSGSGGATGTGSGGRGGGPPAGSGGRGEGGRAGRAGASGSGGSGAGATAGATGTGGMSMTGNGGSTGTGTCTASKSVSANASGTGPHKVVVETNSDKGIVEGTIFRPMDLGGTEKYPIFVWGEGGCSENGLSNSAAMAEIASHGYFVIADGIPNGTASRSMNSGDVASMGKPLLAYVDWAIAENGKSCSAYYQSLDTTKVAANGFSCGGLMAEGTAADPRITTWGLNSSGLLSPNQAFYKTVHTPVLIVLGGSGDIAYQNGENDYTSIAALGIPIMLFSKALGHGGDLFSSHGGDFTKIDLAWLNWQLKGDETATGKGLLVGASCTYCTNSAWEVKSMNIQ